MIIIVSKQMIVLYLNNQLYQNHNITYMNKIDLNEWEICNPDNRQDQLPQPYRLISEVLNETILHQLNLSMFEIQEKKKDKNYQGTIKQYLSQNTIDVQNISCLSNITNHHNYLLSGDKTGNIYLLDLAKKIVFSKKQILQGKRVQFITQSFITDGDIGFTTAAVILNNHSKIYILRYKHGEPKLIITHQIIISASTDDANKLPYYCQFDDYSRLLIVYTYQGTILIFRIPQIPIDLDIINKQQSIPLQEEQFKKKLRYPFNYASIQHQIKKISQNILQIKFPGKPKAISRQQLLNKYTKKVEIVAQTQVKKDPKKKQQKKEQKNEQAPNEGTAQMQFNTPIIYKETILQNGQDNSPNYPLPKYRPFVWILHSKIQLDKKKQFEKGKTVDISEKIIYGWTNVKHFNICYFLPLKKNYYCNYIYIQHHLQKIPEQYAKQKNTIMSEKIVIKNSKILKNIYEITSTCLSLPDQYYFATGMANGVTSIWSTNSLNVLMTTDKQIGSISQLAFFQKWKLISGTSKGQIQIDNILTQSNEVKRTNIFQSKIDYPIIKIKISELGIAFVLDSNANLRVYDLWRNQKIAKIISCNSFAQMENKAKRWLSANSFFPNIPIYTNNDFTTIISVNWPNYTSIQLADSRQKSQEINSLLSNQWKAKGTNIHVIRNFQFLLNFFDGLETVYKKGYDRKKVQNLFSNLQFTQLYDRSFDIPDFGMTNGSKKAEKTSEGSMGVASRSMISSKSREKKMKESSSASQVKPRLTNEVLHPQKFLLQRRKIHTNQVITDQVLKSKIRDSFKKQNALENALQNDLSKGLL